MLSLVLSACGGNSEIDGRSDRSEKNEGIQIAEESVEEASLNLYLNKTNFIVGETARLTLTAYSDTPLTEPVTIVDENDEILAALMEDGTGAYRGQIEIYEESERRGILTAKSGEMSSLSKHFHVHPEITEEMVEKLLSVSESLGNFVLEQDYEAPYSEEALGEVEEWLENHIQIAATEETNGLLFYETEDHLLGSYGMSQWEEDSFGFSAPSEAFAVYDSTGNLYWHNYQYNDYKIMSDYEFQMDEPTNHYEYEYDSEGQLKKLSFYGPMGETGGWYEYTTDELGRIRSRISYSSDGKQVRYCDYTWDGDRLITLNEWGETGGDAENRVVYRTRFTYDSEGRCISENSENGSGYVYNIDNLYYEDGLRTYAEYCGGHGEGRSSYTYYTYRELKVSKEVAEMYRELSKNNPNSY